MIFYFIKLKITGSEIKLEKVVFTEFIDLKKNPLIRLIGSY